MAVLQFIELKAVTQGSELGIIARGVAKCFALEFFHVY